MSCNGCGHGSELKSYILRRLLPGYDPDSVFPFAEAEVLVNSINPDASAGPGSLDPDPYPAKPWESYTPPPDHPPTWTVSEDPNVVDNPRQIDITLSRFWATGWNGSCSQTSQGCEQATSCTIRLYLRWRIKVTYVVSTVPGLKPELPELPPISINSAAPHPVLGWKYSELAFPIPTPPPLPPDEVGPVTQEHGNPLPTVTNSPGASVGAEYNANGTSRGFRDYYVEAIYKAVPNCDVRQEWSVPLDTFDIVIDGEVSGSSASTWNIVENQPVSDDNIDVTVHCGDCYNSGSGYDPEPKDPPAGSQDTGKNANPNSINNI